MSAWPTIAAASFGYTTVAPRGIDSTKSDSSGRRARYSTPPVELTITPSGRPIKSSWAMAPLWVWKSLPFSNTTVCSLPLLSLSCTRSPSRSVSSFAGGRCARSSAGMTEESIQVSDDQDALDSASWVGSEHDWTRVAPETLDEVVGLQR